MSSKDWMLIVLILLASWLLGVAFIDGKLYLNGRLVPATVVNSFTQMQPRAFEGKMSSRIRRVTATSDDGALSDTFNSENLQEGDRLYFLHDSYTGAYRVVTNPKSRWQKFRSTWRWPLLVVPAVMFLRALRRQLTALKAALQMQVRRLSQPKFRLEWISETLNAACDSSLLLVCVLAWLATCWLGMLALAAIPVSNSIIQGGAIALFLAGSFLPVASWIDKMERGEIRHPTLVHLMNVAKNIVFLLVVIALTKNIWSSDAIRNPTSLTSVGKVLLDLLKSMIGL